MQISLVIDPCIVGIIWINYASAIVFRIQDSPIISAEVNHFGSRSSSGRLPLHHVDGDHTISLCRKVVRLQNRMVFRLHEHSGIIGAKMDGVLPRRVQLDLSKWMFTKRLNPPRATAACIKYNVLPPFGTISSSFDDVHLHGASGISYRYVSYLDRCFRRGTTRKQDTHGQAQESVASLLYIRCIGGDSHDR